MEEGIHKGERAWGPWKPCMHPCVLSRSVVSDSLWPYGLWPTRLLWGFSRQEYWSGLPCLPSGDLPNPGIEPGSPALQADSLPPEPPGRQRLGSHLLQCPLGPSSAQWGHRACIKVKSLTWRTRLGPGREGSGRGDPQKTGFTPCPISGEHTHLQNEGPPAQKWKSRQQAVRAPRAGKELVWKLWDHTGVKSNTVLIHTGAKWGQVGGGGVLAPDPKSPVQSSPLPSPSQQMFTEDLPRARNFYALASLSFKRFMISRERKARNQYP